MSEKTLKFNNIKVNKKEFHKSKQAIDLDSVIVDQRNRYQQKKPTSKKKKRLYTKRRVRVNLNLSKRKTKSLRTRQKLS